MVTSLLVLPVHRKRDVLSARTRARQVARLLGFDALEQACIGAAVFEIACRAREQGGRAILHSQADGTTFQVFPQLELVPRRAAEALVLRLEKPLPAREPSVGADDLAWVVQQLAVLTPEDPFAEMQRQNQELLLALVELQGCRAKLATTTPEPARPAA